MGKRKNQDQPIIRPCKRSEHNVHLPEADHLSDLHESILSDILSRLPTKDVVRTSVLSKQWKYKWTCMNHVDVTDYSPGKASFAKFVDMIFSLAHDLKIVRLLCNGVYNFSCASAWIYEIFRRDNIKSLELLCLGVFKEKGIVLPWVLLDRPSFENLNLGIPGCTFNVIAKNSFINLKTFCLWEINIQNGFSSSNSLILDFPALELFEVIKCRWVNVKFVKINAPVLNTFVSETYTIGGPNNYSIEIIGSKLSTFRCSGGFPDDIILAGSEVVSASFKNIYDSEHDMMMLHSSLRIAGSQVKKLLNESSRLIELTLSEFVVRALQLGPPLRRHDELIRLTLLDPSHAMDVFELLRRAPSLKFLSVNVDSWDEGDFDAVETLPSCIISHLEEVELYLFTGTPCQYNLANFLLKSGRALKKLSFFHPSCLWDDILSELSFSPRISRSLTLVSLYGCILGSTVVLKKKSDHCLCPYI